MEIPAVNRMAGPRPLLHRDVQRHYVRVRYHYYWISGTRNRLYEVAVSPSECSIVKEIPVCFDVDELREHAYGFADLSPSVRYSLNEDAINPLSRFITGHVNGAQFSKEKQLEGFGKVAVNLDGTCGEKVCEFLMEYSVI